MSCEHREGPVSCVACAMLTRMTHEKMGPAEQRWADAGRKWAEAKRQRDAKQIAAGAQARGELARRRRLKLLGF